MNMEGLTHGERIQNRSVIFFTLRFVIRFGITIVIAQEGLLDSKIFVGQFKEKHKSALKKTNSGFGALNFTRKDYLFNGTLKE
jgi:hypothetical protein